MGEVVPFVRGDAQVRFPDETKRRCFELYSTLAARNCSHVERMYAAEVAGSDEPIPTRRTIAQWARDESWAQQADELWRSTRGWTGEQMRHYLLANALLAEKNRHDIQMGLYAGREAEAIVLLKAGELADRKQERIMPLSELQPPPRQVDTSAMSQAQKEAYLQSQLVQRTRKRA
jgi:hypothetical protein